LKYLIIIVLIFSHLFTKAQNETLIVISNKKGAPEEMKMTELKSIMMGERQRWKDGNKIKIALMKPNTPTGTSTCKKVYDMNVDEVKKFWLQLVFQGKALAPDFFNSEAELKAFVSQNEGAIGIIEIPGDSPDVQVVSIDGKKEF
jgi:ABC-type phosphate transport system substrate-binding protein